MRDDPQAHARRVELGRWLRELRQERGLTQAELARAARMGQATLSNYEKGRREIPSAILVSVASALGLSIGEVLDVDHILIVRDERLREAVNILVREPDVLDSIVGPRPPPPPRPRRERKEAGEQDGDDGERTDASDEISGADDESGDAGDESGGAEGERNSARDESSGTAAEGESAGADDPGGAAQQDTGAQA